MQEELKKPILEIEKEDLATVQGEWDAKIVEEMIQP